MLHYYGSSLYLMHANDITILSLTLGNILHAVTMAINLKKPYRPIYIMYHSVLTTGKLSALLLKIGMVRTRNNEIKNNERKQ